MPETKSVRVVPSGKIYRQMFDAQLQLSKSLDKVVSRNRNLPEFAKISTHNLPTSAPVFRLTREDTAHGILTKRQKTWSEAFPNDPYTENPILYKQYRDFVCRQFGISENFEAGKDVRGLPDIVVPAKRGSDIIERITGSRKERHEAAIEDMYQELSVISAETEPKIAQVSEETLQMLADGSIKTAHILARIEKDEDLLTFSLDNLMSLWKGVEQYSPQHQALIRQLDAKLKTIEEGRMKMIRDVFQDYGEKLKQISYLMLPDLERLLDRDSQVINQMCLSNRRAYADLFVRLMSADLEREKMQQLSWRRRVEDWKMLKTNLAVQSFRNFMESEVIARPPGVENVREFMITELEILNSQRLELIQSLRDLNPPAATKPTVYKWRKQMQSVAQELENVSHMHLSKLHEEMESVCQSCLKKIEDIKKSIVEAGIATETKAQQMVAEHMLPLVGEHQKMFEQSLETMEKSLLEHSKRMDDEMHSIFKFSQGAAHLWDVHEIGLAKQERALQEKLDDCRHEHDYANQEREANLDIVMDRMRQDPSEASLRDSLSKVFDMLEKIQESYKEFHQSQKDIVFTYPDMVQLELDKFDQAICTFFSLDHTNPEDRGNADEDVQMQPSPDPTTDSVSARTQREPSQKQFRQQSMLKGQDQLPITEENKTLAKVVAEVLSTEKGTTFYVLKVAGDYGIPEQLHQEHAVERGEQQDSDINETSGAFLTEVPAAADAMPEYLKAVDISAEVLIEVRKRIRMNFLNFLEKWSEEAKERAASVVVAKCEELNSELDLRLHLHQPRSRRAEYDVHNVRAAELVMHAERVTRHCKGVDQSLSELRARFVAMSSEHNKLATKFRQDIEALEVVFINATKSSRLVALQNQLAAELDKFMSVIRTSLRQFRQHLDETLQMLRDSNARFIKSFKLFSEGGNFCPEEVEEYRKRLEKMSHRIDGSEGSIMSELEGMESKRLEVASRVASEFEDRFRSHMFDLLFMEKIARWFTNTQVKIKSEVAASNSQAQALARYLDYLELRIDACEQPRFDQEQITAAQLNEFLKSVMEAFQKRCGYLNVRKEIIRPQSSQPPVLTTEPRDVSPCPSVSKVGFASEMSVGKFGGGKQPAEDPTVSIIKSILTTQKFKRLPGYDNETEDQASIGVAGTPTSGSPTDPTREKNKSTFSQPSIQGEKLVAGRGPTLPSLVTDFGRLLGPKRPSKTAKLDKARSFVGDKELEETAAREEDHFMGLILSTLQEAMSGLTAAAEIYYKEKGARPVTRPQVLQETLEQCCDVFTQKLQSYYQQADEYHNHCLQEFRQQLTRQEQLAACVPGVLIRGLVSQHIHRTQSAQAILHAEFKKEQDESDMKKKEHQNSLRPTMGHPHLSPALEALSDQEIQRHEDYMVAVEKHISNLQMSAEENAKLMLNALEQLSEQQLIQYYDLLITDEVERGRVEPVRLPTVELIRRKNAGEPLQDDEEKNLLPRGRGNWLGFPSNQFVLENRPSKVQLTSTLSTTKTTLGHSSTIRARDTGYEDYKAVFEKMAATIAEEKSQLLQAEKHWLESWKASIQHVKNLYKTA